MDPPEQETPWELQATRRARVAEARRRTRRRFILISIPTILGVAILGGAGWFWLVRGSDSVAQRVVAPTTTTTAPRLGEECRAPLSFLDPLRLWIGGDSLAGSLGPALGEQTADTGVVLPTYDARTSSGLSNPQFFDWPEHATGELARLLPEIVVFIIGTNDFAVPNDEPKDINGVPAWRAKYAALVEEILGVLEAGGRHAYIVGPPIMRDKRKGEGAKQTSELMREVVAGHPDAHFIDAYKLFSDDDGKYTQTRPGPTGKEVRVRAGDGIHFTPEGGQLLADQVFTLLDGRCRVLEQAIPGREQPVRQTPGSSASGNRGPTRTPTNASATAPPTSPATAPTTTTIVELVTTTSSATTTTTMTGP